VVDQYRQARAVQDLSSLDRQVAKAKDVVVGVRPVKPVPFVVLCVYQVSVSHGGLVGVGGASR
jgi:hypothetical protein